MTLSATEEILSIYFPLHALVHSYSCPAFDSWASSFSPVKKPPSADLVWVIDVGKAFSALPDKEQQTLFCLHGRLLGYRATARRLSATHTSIRRWEARGLGRMSRRLRRKGVGIPMRLLLKHG